MVQFRLAKRMTQFRFSKKLAQFRLSKIGTISLLKDWHNFASQRLAQFRLPKRWHNFASQRNGTISLPIAERTKSLSTGSHNFASGQFRLGTISLRDSFSLGQFRLAQFRFRDNFASKTKFCKTLKNPLLLTFTQKHAHT